MKTILIALFATICLQAFSQKAAPKHLIHFMQQAPLPANEIPFGANPKAGRYVTVGDAKIYYEVYGKGKPLVILHGGIVGSTFEMYEFIDSLSKHYQVIAISTRGHGSQRWVHKYLLTM